jgi:hypothetical protein
MLPLVKKPPGVPADQCGLPIVLLGRMQVARASQLLATLCEPGLLVGTRTEVNVLRDFSLRRVVRTRCQIKAASTRDRMQNSVCSRPTSDHMQQATAFQTT